MNITDIYETMEYSPAPESPDIAFEWLKERKAKFGLFINGKWCNLDFSSMENGVKPSPENFSELIILRLEKNWPRFLLQEKAMWIQR